MTVIVLGTLRFPPENMAGVRPHLRVLVEKTREHDGCLAYDVAEDLFNPGLVRFSESWPDRATLARHLQAQHIAPWRKVAAEYGVHDRNFVAYDAANPAPI